MRSLQSKRGDKRCTSPNIRINPRIGRHGDGGTQEPLRIAGGVQAALWPF